MDSLSRIAPGACIGEAFFEKGFGKKVNGPADQGKPLTSNLQAFLSVIHFLKIKCK